MQLLTFSKSLKWYLTVINGTVFDLSWSTLKYWGSDVWKHEYLDNVFLHFLNRSTYAIIWLKWKIKIALENVAKTIDFQSKD